jgi:crossover junction endodeoxyribonuclease RuvC
MRIKNQAELERWLAQNKMAPARPATREAARQGEPVDPSRQRRIIGLDTALRCTGWGMVDVRGNQLKAVDCGVIKNPPKTAMSDCLRRLAGGIRELIELYRPDIAVIEGGFFCRNVKTAMVLGSARGAVIAALAEAGIPIHEYAPRRVKQAVCGFGNASKQQVALLVAQFLAIQIDRMPLDSSDALALALCHAQNLTVAQGHGLSPEI